MAAQKHPPRYPGNCILHGGLAAASAGDDAAAIKWNCLHVVGINFELGGKGRGDGCVWGRTMNWHPPEMPGWAGFHPALFL